MTIELFFKLLGSLSLLIYGMKTMSDALQKMAGPSLRHVLARMTGNRLSGMLTGTMVTCTGHQRHYGCQYRHYTYGVDHVAGL